MLALTVAAWLTEQGSSASVVGLRVVAGARAATRDAAVPHLQRGW